MRERGCFPVAETLRLGYASPEDYSVDFLEACIRDAELLDKLLKLHEPGRGKLATPMEHLEVVTQRQPYLQYGIVLQKIPDRVYADVVKPEQKRAVKSRHLHQGHFIHVALAK